MKLLQRGSQTLLPPPSPSSSLPLSPQIRNAATEKLGAASFPRNEHGVAARDGGGYPTPPSASVHPSSGPEMQARGFKVKRRSFFRATAFRNAREINNRRGQRKKGKGRKEGANDEVRIGNRRERAPGETLGRRSHPSTFPAPLPPFQPPLLSSPFVGEPSMRCIFTLYLRAGVSGVPRCACGDSFHLKARYRAREDTRGLVINPVIQRVALGIRISLVAAAPVRHDARERHA